MVRKVFLLLGLMLSFQLRADLPYHLLVGEEVFCFQRNRSGGTHQEGRVDGIRVGLERSLPYSWYGGVDFLYASGRLRGTTGTQRALRSTLTDETFEARLGFTLQTPPEFSSFITPYAGWGYFKEVNNFHEPSPIPCKFTETFNYVVVGFLSGVYLTPVLSMGINFKVEFMLDAKSKVTGAPRVGDVTILIQNETNYRVEVPLTYATSRSFLGVNFQLCPFYEFRHFGGRQGFPFNYSDTKFHLYGVRLASILLL